MKNDKQKESEKKPSASDKMLDKAANTLNWWNKISTINKDDSLLMGFTKIMIRILGILILLAISPFVILGLIVGATAAL